MTHASELQRLSAAAIWHNYDPASKTELFSTALAVKDGYLVIDPIPLATAAVAELIANGRIAGIVVTNENHHRAAADWSEQFTAPIFAHAATFDSNNKPARFQEIAAGDRLFDSVDVIAIEGAVPGEVALHDGGTLVLGDCLINFEPYGFTFLPPKYCANSKLMKRSLAQLLGLPTQRIFFAHGTPMLTRAADQLVSLLK